MNEAIAFESRGLMEKRIMSACYTRNGVAHVKKTECSRAQKIYHTQKCGNDVNLEDDEREQLFLDRSQDTNNFISHTIK